MKTIQKILVGVTVCWLMGAARGELVLADRAANEAAAIVIRAQATACERYAAEELRDHLVKVTGVTPAIVDDSGALPAKSGEPWRHVESRAFVYMPIFNAGPSEAAFAETRKAFAAWDAAPYAPPAYEVCIPGAAPVDTLFADMRKSPNKPRLWINTLWDSLAHNHSESLKGDDFTPGRVWGWCLELGATMIQTDRPADCIRYLDTCGRRVL